MSIRLRAAAFATVTALTSMGVVAATAPAAQATTTKCTGWSSSSITNLSARLCKVYDSDYFAIKVQVHNYGSIKRTVRGKATLTKGPHTTWSTPTNKAVYPGKTVTLGTAALYGAGAYSGGTVSCPIVGKVWRTSDGVRIWYKSMKVYC